MVKWNACLDKYAHLNVFDRGRSRFCARSVGQVMSSNRQWNAVAAKAARNTQVKASELAALEKQGASLRAFIGNRRIAQSMGFSPQDLDRKQAQATQLQAKAKALRMQVQTAKSNVQRMRQGATKLNVVPESNVQGGGKAKKTRRP
jgi:hypothetical protein